MSSKELDNIIAGIAKGLPFDMRWGGYIVSEALKYEQPGVSAMRLAAVALEAAVLHPEWAIAAVQELHRSGMLATYPTEEIQAEAERMVRLAFIERSEQ